MKLEVQQVFNSFVWNYKPPRLKFATIIQGAQNVDFTIVVNAQKQCGFKRIYINERLAAFQYLTIIPQMKLRDCRNYNRYIKQNTCVL